MTETTTIETKAADTFEAATAHETLNRAFEAFKETNDARLAEIAAGRADVLTEEKLARIETGLQRTQDVVARLDLKAARPRLEGAVLAPTATKSAFDAYVRRGDASRLYSLEEKAMTVGTAADGGYTVPLEIETEIGMRLAKSSPIRALASVKQVSGSTYRKPFSTNGFAVGWVAETATRTQTASTTLDALDFPTMELYAMPAASPQLLEDSAIDVDRWIAEEVEMAFAEQEGEAFVKGNGTGKPKGFLSYTMIADASWEWSKIGFVASGAAGGFPTTDPADKLLDLVYALRAGYRQNGTFVMNRKTQAVVRKFKDGSGQYLWNPPAQVGGQASLMTFPLVEAEDMPDIGANEFPVAFGDFRRGYLVIDRLGLRILRDPYSAKPYVLFYTTKRVGGGVQDFAAIKLLKIAA